MDNKRISSGSEVIDSLLNGGFETDILTTVYGPGGSGKTNICIIAAVNIAKQNKKVIYIDTESGFSLERLKQIDADYKTTLNNILFLRPSSFKEQKKAFEKLKGLIEQNIGLIVVDTIAMLYRIELGKGDEVYEANRELGLQISYLAEIVRKNNIPVLISTQVYSSFDNSNSVKMVGGDILKYWSKCLLEIKKLHNNERTLIIKKHRSIEENRSIRFRISNKGIEKI